MAEQRRSRTAAELAPLVAEYIAAKDMEALAELFDEDGRWEIVFGLSGLSPEELVVRGRRHIGKFHATMSSLIDTVRFYDSEVTAVTDELAFFEFRSDARTVKGQSYGNRYICKVKAKNGLIVHWLEFFDPRPAEMIRASMAEAIELGSVR